MQRGPQEPLRRFAHNYDTDLRMRLVQRACELQYGGARQVRTKGHGLRAPVRDRLDRVGHIVDQVGVPPTTNIRLAHVIQRPLDAVLERRVQGDDDEPALFVER